MATILIAYLIKKRKKRKQAQKENAEARYAELQRETSERISRTNTGELLNGDGDADADEGEDGEKVLLDARQGAAQQQSGGLASGGGLGAGEVVSAGLYGGVQGGGSRGGTAVVA